MVGITNTNTRVSCRKQTWSSLYQKSPRQRGLFCGIKKLPILGRRWVVFRQAVVWLDGELVDLPLSSGV